jgi:hypothetical protein
MQAIVACVTGASAFASWASCKPERHCSRADTCDQRLCLQEAQPTGVHSAISKQGAVGLAACGFLPSCCIRLWAENASAVLAQWQKAANKRKIHRTLSGECTA